MELVRLTLRKHPVTAWTFIAFAAVGAALVFTNQLLTFLKHVGAMHGAP